MVRTSLPEQILHYHAHQFRLLTLRHEALEREAHDNAAVVAVICHAGRTVVLSIAQHGKRSLAERRQRIGRLDAVVPLRKFGIVCILTG